VAGSSCVFAAQLVDPGQRPLIERRATRLGDLYGPLGEDRVRLRWVQSLRLLLGTVGPAAEAPDLDGVLTWGGPVPASLLDRTRLLAATDGDLRRLDAIAALASASEERARLVAGAGGVTTLYAARSGNVAAWSTRATAAAWLTHGKARVDVGALPEFVTFEYAGGERTLIAGARALPVATRIDLSPTGPSEASYWPREERWSPVPEARASGHAERALLESLGRRLDGVERPLLGLTGGLDSRVAAVALRELGIPFEALTWGAPDSRERRAAQEVAEALGAPHRFREAQPPDTRAALVRLTRLALSSDGTCPLDLWGDVLPAAGSAFVIGLGGEVGRAFYYMPRALEEPDPSIRRLRRLLAVPVRIPRARREAVRAVERRLEGWLADAETLGYRGWARLDAMYGEQRLRRWGRLVLQRSEPPVVGAFATPEVTRALASLPLVERVSSGFHRRFLSARAPELASPPRPVVRTAAPLRWARSAIAPVVRPAVDAVRRARAPGRGTWPDATLWSGRSELRSWLEEEVLGSPLLREALGERWAHHTREQFRRDEWRATTKTLLAASPVALERALRELEADAGGRSGADTLKR
jgi:hypothetical protein